MKNETATAGALAPVSHSDGLHKWVATLGKPVLVAALAFAGKEVITQEQQKSALELEVYKAQTGAQLANDAARRELLGQFLALLSSSDETQRVRAVQMLAAVDPELGAQLAGVVARDTKQPEPVRAAAARAVSQAPPKPLPIPPAATSPTSPPTVQPKPKKSACGCAAGDLQCAMRCAAG